MTEFEKRLACVIAADGSIARGYMIDKCELVGAMTQASRDSNFAMAMLAPVLKEISIGR